MTTFGDQACALWHPHKKDEDHFDKPNRWWRMILWYVNTEVLSVQSTRQGREARFFVANAVSRRLAAWRAAEPRESASLNFFRARHMISFDIWDAGQSKQPPVVLA